LDVARTLRSGLFWTGSATFVLIGAAAALYGPALPAFARAFGLSVAEAGLLVSAHNMGGLVGLLASAALGVVTARQSILIIVAGAALIASGLAWWLTLVGAVLLGAGYGLVAAVLNRRFLTESGAEGPAMVGLLNAIFGIGAIGGPMLLLAVGGSPGLAFALVAVAMLLLVPFASGGVAEAPAAIAHRRLLRSPGILLLGAAAIGFEVSLIGLGPAALVARGTPEADAAWLASLFFAFFLASRVSLVWLAPRFRPLSLLAAAFAAGAVLAGTAAVAPPGLFFAVAGASVGILFPTYFVAAAQALGTDARAAALTLASGYVGAVLLPAAMSGLIGLYGAPILFPALAAFAALCCAAALFLDRRGSRGA
jgi:fucose permease